MSGKYQRGRQNMRDSSNSGKRTRGGGKGGGGDWVAGTEVGT